MVGPRQQQILDLLRDGAAILNAIIAHLDPGNPARVHASLKTLAARGLVVGGRQRKHDLSAMVALAEPASGACIRTPRRPAGDDFPHMAARLRA
jgi:hypothetical protein